MTIPVADLDFSEDHVSQLQGDFYDAIEQIDLCQRYALIAGSMALVVGFSTRAAHREEGRQRLAVAIKYLRHDLAAALSMDVVQEVSGQIRQHYAKVEDCIQQLEAFLALEDASVNEAAAMAIQRMTEDDLIHQIYEIVRVVERADEEFRRARDVSAAQISVRMNEMLHELEQIGRTIRIISLNAAVEAARTGGTAGGSFKVIADEIRNLSSRSGDLVAQTRSQMNRMEQRLGR